MRPRPHLARRIRRGAGAPPPPPPVFSAAPSIATDGSPQVGETVILNDGIANAGIAVREVLRDGVAIATVGANGAGYTLVTADEGKAIAYRNVALGPGGQTPAVSAAIVPAAAPDTTPDQFAFAAVENAPRSTLIESNPITVQGTNMPAPIAIADGEYRIGSGAWTTSAGTVAPGATVRARRLSSASYATLARARLTIGGVQAFFDITTEAALDGLEPTTLQTSIMHRSATYVFDRPMPVGRYADGQPFVVSTEPFSIVQITPDSALVPTTLNQTVTDINFATSSSPAGTTYLANGAMRDPYFPDLVITQGFDALLSRSASGDQNAAITQFSASLNVDPATAGPLALSTGTATSVVKSVRRAGFVNVSGATGSVPSRWRHFDDWCVLHVVPTTPPLGAFAPAPSDLDKTSYFTTAMRNKGALGSGFALPAGKKSLATVIAEDTFRSFQPWWVVSTEHRRRWIAHGNDALIEGGYSRDFGSEWNDYVSGLLAAGSAVADGPLNDALAFGIQQVGMHNRGWRGGSGAGQWSGHKQFVQLVGHVFASRPGVMDKCLEIDGNVNSMHFWVNDFHVGIPTRWPGNHGIQQGTFTPEHVGLPDWNKFFVDGDYRAGNSLEMDGDPDKNYESSSNPAALGELINICLLKQGPGGLDGSQVMVRNAGWGPSNRHAAVVAYLDRAFARGEHYLVINMVPKDRAMYAQFRDTFAAPRWAGVPDLFNPTPSKQAPFLFAPAGIDGAFDWNLANAGGITEAVLEHQIQYSHDMISWTSVTTPGVTGRQTGLAPGRKYYVRLRRRSASGWGPWSVNYPYKVPGQGQASEQLERLIVTPTGTPSGAVVNASAPALFQRSYPRWAGPTYQPINDPIDLSRTIQLFAGVGRWTGAFGAFTYQWFRNGVAISGATNPSYTLAVADLGAGLRCDVTNSGVTASTPVVNIPALPALPAGTIVETSFEASFALYYAEVMSSFVASSTQVGGTLNVVLDPTYVRATAVGETLTEITRGVLRGVKSNATPTLNANVAARQPLVPGTTYRVRAKIPVAADMTTSHATNVRFGNVLGGSQHFSTSYPARDVSSPVENSIDFNFTAGAGQTALWMQVQSFTPVGGPTGGNPMISELSVAAVA